MNSKIPVIIFCAALFLMTAIVAVYLDMFGFNRVPDQAT